MLFSLLTSGYEPYIIFALLLAYVISLATAFSLHEFGHAYVADREGDSTARLMGRKSINPLKHLDPIGLISLLVFGFGWAKPVPVNPALFRNGKKSEVKVALAGILINLSLAIIFSLILAIIETFFIELIISLNFFAILIYYIVYFSLMINIMLAIFNLIPIFPLDGSRLLELYAGPDNNIVVFLKKYSLYILIALLIVPVSTTGSSILSTLLSYVSDGITFALNWLWTTIFSIFI